MSDGAIPVGADDDRAVRDFTETVAAAENVLVRQAGRLSSEWARMGKEIAGLERDDQLLALALKEFQRQFEAFVAALKWSPSPEQIKEAGIMRILNVREDFSTRTVPAGEELVGGRFVSYMNTTGDEVRRGLDDVRLAGWITVGMKRAAVRPAVATFGAGIVEVKNRKRELAQELKKLQQAREAQMRILLNDGNTALGQALRWVDDARRQAPRYTRPWDDPVWAADDRSTGNPVVLLGERSFETGLRGTAAGSFADGVTLPLFGRPDQGLHLAAPGGAEGRERTHALVRSLLMRSLAARPPGDLRLTIFDPVSLGQSVSSLLELAEYDPELLGGKVWSSTRDLREQLAAQTAHMELVIQKYLRSDFENIDEFNKVAGEIAEPYRLVVIMDFPKNFDEESVHELQRIIENGPRCGVGTILVSNPNEPPPYGVDLTKVSGNMWTLNVGQPSRVVSRDAGYAITSWLDPDNDADAGPEVVRGLVESVGRGAQEDAAAVLEFGKTFNLFNEAAAAGVRKDLPGLEGEVDPDNPATWWNQSTTNGISAPLGQTGARDVATLTFDSSNHAGALLVGRPGSGKSTLIHSYVAGITAMYSPDELELHLIDFKEGVEFKAYAEHSLPHARSIAIESDREFGLSVLQAINAEANRRGKLFRDGGGTHTSLQTLRTETGEQLPRILLVFDEFQVLFAKSDKVGTAAADLLENLIRQGRGFGIHVLLASQSLSGLDALGSHVPQLLPVRILMPASENDASRVLGDGNTGGKLLEKTGEGILNPRGGAVEANQLFRGALLTEENRDRHLRTLRNLADQAGHTRQPVVFEGRQPIPLDEGTETEFVEAVRDAPRHALRLRFGLPMSIAGSSDISLRREDGANLLLVARDLGVEATGEGDSTFSLPRAVVTNLLLSAAVGGSRIEAVDFMPVDDGLEEPLAPLIAAGRVKVHRRRRIGTLLEETGALVTERVESDDVTAPPVLMVLYGMHRARDFDSESFDYDSDVDLPGLLRKILMDGPEVGVHTVIWADSMSGLQRRLEPSMSREMAWRLASQMSEDDSHALLGSDRANGLREQQLVVGNEDLGVLQKVTAFAQPGSAWLERALAAAGRGE